MNARAYYNEIDPYAAQWLRNLIAAGHIASGDVDERSIVDVRADDIKGYTQCHFFAGIGGWSVALRLAGWDDDRPVWTGSCPCQPFSAAGAGKAADDGRHLWPAWFPLIAECGHATVFGEQVEAAIGWGWLDAVFADLEGAGYACGAAVLPACGVGAPHIRNRLWFVGRLADARRGDKQQCGNADEVLNERYGAQGSTDSISGSGPNGTGRPMVSTLADTDGGNASTEGLQRGGEYGQRAQDGGVGEVAHPDSARRPDAGQHERRSSQLPARSAEHGSAGELGDAARGGFGEFGHAAQPRRGRHVDGASEPSAVVNADGERKIQIAGVRGGPQSEHDRTGPLNGFWHDAEWIACTDGKARPVGPGSFPLGHGIQRRTSKLRAYGNAIVPQIAAEFIMSASVGEMERTG